VFPVERNRELSFGIQDNLIQQIRVIGLEVAKTLVIPVIDLYLLTEKHPEWFPDGVHPNKEGNQKIAQYIKFNVNF